MKKLFRSTFLVSFQHRRRIFVHFDRKNLLILAEVKNFIHYEKSNESLFFPLFIQEHFFHQLQRNFGSYIRFNCICTNTTSGTFRRPLKLHNYEAFFYWLYLNVTVEKTHFCILNNFAFK